RLARCIIEIGVEAESDEVGRRLRPRHGPAEILAHRELERAGERCLDRRAVDLAVALRRMAVSGREQGALVPHRQIDGAAGGELLAVEIAAELARLLAVLPSEHR